MSRRRNLSPRALTSTHVTCFFATTIPDTRPVRDSRAALRDVAAKRMAWLLEVRAGRADARTPPVVRDTPNARVRWERRSFALCASVFVPLATTSLREFYQQWVALETHLMQRRLAHLHSKLRAVAKRENVSIRAAGSQLFVKFPWELEEAPVDRARVCIDLPASGRALPLCRLRAFVVPNAFTDAQRRHACRTLRRRLAALARPQ